MPARCVAGRCVAGSRTAGMFSSRRSDVAGNPGSPAPSDFPSLPCPVPSVSVRFPQSAPSGPLCVRPVSPVRPVRSPLCPSDFPSLLAGAFPGTTGTSLPHFVSRHFPVPGFPHSLRSRFPALPCPTLRPDISLQSSDDTITAGLMTGTATSVTTSVTRVTKSVTSVTEVVTKHTVKPRTPPVTGSIGRRNAIGMQSVWTAHHRYTSVRVMNM